MAADIFTKAFTDHEKWKHACTLINHIDPASFWSLPIGDGGIAGLRDKKKVRIAASSVSSGCKEAVQDPDLDPDLTSDSEWETLEMVENYTAFDSDAETVAPEDGEEHSPHGVTARLDEGAPLPDDKLAVYPRRWQGVTHLRPPGKHGPRDDRTRYVQAYDADSGKRLFSGGCPQGCADSLTAHKILDSPGDVRFLYFLQSKRKKEKRCSTSPEARARRQTKLSFITSGDAGKLANDPSWGLRFRSVE
jgi:hypothetical protein